MSPPPARSRQIPKKVTAVSTMPKGFITSVMPTISRQSASSRVRYQCV